MCFNQQRVLLLFPLFDHIATLMVALYNTELCIENLYPFPNQQLSLTLPDNHRKLVNCNTHEKQFISQKFQCREVFFLSISLLFSFRYCSIMFVILYFYVDFIRFEMKCHLYNSLWKLTHMCPNNFFLVLCSSNWEWIAVSHQVCILSGAYQSHIERLLIFFWRFLIYFWQFSQFVMFLSN